MIKIMLKGSVARTIALISLLVYFVRVFSARGYLPGYGLARLLSPVAMLALYSLYLSLSGRNRSVLSIKKTITAIVASLAWVGSFLALAAIFGAALNPYTPTWRSAIYNVMLNAPLLLMTAIASSEAARTRKKLVAAAFLALTFAGLNTNVIISLLLELLATNGKLFTSSTMLEVVTTALFVVALYSASRKTDALPATLLVIGMWLPKGVLAWAPNVPKELYLVLKTVILSAVLLGFVSIESNYSFNLPSTLTLKGKQKHLAIIPALLVMPAILLALLWKGYWPLLILTGSMSPTLNPGDIIVVKPFHGHLAKGDIVAYVRNRQVIVHRIKAVYNNGTIITKGDANTAEDPPVSLKQVIGVPLLKIPYLGLPISYLAILTGSMLTAQLSLAATVLLLALLSSYLRRELKSNRDKFSE